MIEYSFWTEGKVDGVEALVFKSAYDQNTFCSVVTLDSIVGQNPENAKATSKAVVLPDPVVKSSLVYNGNRKGRKYKTVVEYDGGFSDVQVHEVVGVRSIAYPDDRKIESIKVYVLGRNGSEKQVFELLN
jgi:hypothetical protein